jgi:hypothetical protein
MMSAACSKVSTKLFAASTHSTMAVLKSSKQLSKTVVSVQRLAESASAFRMRAFFLRSDRTPRPVGILSIHLNLSSSKGTRKGESGVGETLLHCSYVNRLRRHRLTLYALAAYFSNHSCNSAWLSLSCRSSSLPPQLLDNNPHAIVLASCRSVTSAPD